MIAQALKIAGISVASIWAGGQVREYLRQNPETLQSFGVDDKEFFPILFALIALWALLP